MLSRDLMHCMVQARKLQLKRRISSKNLLPVFRLYFINKLLLVEVAAIIAAANMSLSFYQACKILICCSQFVLIHGVRICQTHKCCR